MQYFTNIPTEVTQLIFSYLRPKQLALCREVCSTWKQIVDFIFEHETLQYAHENISKLQFDLKGIQNIQVVKDGIVGVLTDCGLDYYDICSLEYSNRPPIGHPLSVYRKKSDNSLDQNTSALFGYVYYFMLNNNILYYMTMTKEICVCSLNDNKLKSEPYFDSKLNCLSLGFTEHLNVITYGGDIYSIINKSAELQCRVHCSQMCFIYCTNTIC
ncbi:unnamed protein product [Leptidea sinapis]|uniref:F-box domain-containing protein n=1 Tax=Leptidea sinapis TaxID=189913 RepID=A0A5E4QR47_9NEOP|nr:unnamed protein product [Leptidea sinapis]